jgi:hypothetical protein
MTEFEAFIQRVLASAPGHIGQSPDTEHHAERA